ncbi:hypothetical protein GEMRC1_001939 [Eukaryota sp. GEM-RC1]
MLSIVKKSNRKIKPVLKSQVSDKFMAKRFQSLVLRGQFSSALSSLNHTLPAEVSVETVEKLKKLHPVEEFSGNPVFGELSMSYWTNKPVLVDEILQLISSSPSGRAAGPSGMSFDHFKIAVNAVPEICEDLAVFFNEVLLGTKKLPHALCSSRLVALNKPNGGVRPIAVGETISRIFSTLCFRRVRDSSVEFFRRFQFAVGVPDGTTCAALTSDFLFHSNEENAILNIDFKNAFNCVLRSTISDELSKFFPQLIPYFNIFYGKASNLIYDKFDIKSTRGVKQGDPLGPFLFCLALQKLFKILQLEFPTVKICAYADDSSLIAPVDVLKKCFSRFIELSLSIGLTINIDKCFLVVKSSNVSNLGFCNITIIDYSTQCFRFLGTFLGNYEKIHSELESSLTTIEEKLNQILSLDVSKHVSFAMLQVCFSGKINHFLRSLDYSITETFAKKFNSIRTNFLSNLAEIDESKIPFHAFYSSEFAGVGFTHAKIIRKSALLGGVKNFMFEFLKRFPLDGINLLNSSNCRLIQSAKDLVSSLSPEMWESLFPVHLKETPLKIFHLYHLLYVSCKIN